MEEENITQEDEKVGGRRKLAMKYWEWTFYGIILGIILFILKAAIF